MDDDKVSLVTEEQILKLSGGGDWHVAYILLYGPRRLEKMKEEEEEDAIAPEIDVPMETTASDPPQTNN